MLAVPRNGIKSVHHFPDDRLIGMQLTTLLSETSLLEGGLIQHHSLTGDSPKLWHS